ncbi:MAG: RidA family protein [Novosphingobium sp.]
MDDVVGSVLSSNLLPVSGEASASRIFLTGDLVFVSGQTDRAGPAQGRNVSAQTLHVLDGIEMLLREAGGLLVDVVKATVWLTDPSDYPAFDAAYRTRFAEPFPARTIVAADLIEPGALVQIEVVARRHRQRHPYARPGLSD